MGMESVFRIKTNDVEVDFCYFCNFSLLDSRVKSSKYVNKQSEDRYVISKPFFKEIVEELEPLVNLLRDESQSHCSYWDDNKWPETYAENVEMLSNPFSPLNNTCSSPTYKARKLYTVAKAFIYYLDDFNYQEGANIIYEVSY